MFWTDSAHKSNKVGFSKSVLLFIASYLCAIGIGEAWVTLAPCCHKWHLSNEDARDLSTCVTFPMPFNVLTGKTRPYRTGMGFLCPTSSIQKVTVVLN